MKSYPITLAIALGAALSAPCAGAAVVLSYDIASVVSPASVAVGTIAAGATASSITKSSGIASTIFWNGTPGYFGGGLYSVGSTRNANDYFQFSIQANAGQQITYGNLTYGLFREIVNSAVAGPELWDLVYSLDGFATEGTNIATVTVPKPGVTNALHQATFSTDISAIGTQTGSVTFRLYGYGAVTVGSVGGLGNGTGSGISSARDRAWTGTGSNVILEGTISDVATVPEPSSLVSALTALALAGGLACRPRVRQTSTSISSPCSSIRTRRA